MFYYIMSASRDHLSKITGNSDAGDERFIEALEEPYESKE